MEDAVKFVKKNLTVKVTEAFSWDGTVRGMFEKKLEDFIEENHRDPFANFPLKKKDKIDIMQMVRDEINEEAWEDLPDYPSAIDRALDSYFLQNF